MSLMDRRPRTSKRLASSASPFAIVAAPMSGAFTTVTTVTHPDGTTVTTTAQTTTQTTAAASATAAADAADALFFSTTPCAFKLIAGAAFDYAASCKGFATDASPEVLEALQAASIALKPDGVAADDPSATLWRPTPPGAEALVLDAVPVLDLTLERSKPDGGGWGGALAAPLVKCEAGDPAAAVQGFASGVRSALIHDAASGAWYRLKGCGNNADGFPIVPCLDDAGAPLSDQASGVALRKIRGACYVHTATLELHMSNLVDNMLTPLGMRCANRPVGWWEYGTGPGTDFPQVARCCGLFECEGDRRLGDHVLRGLELLLPLLKGGSAVGKEVQQALVGTGGIMPRSAEAVRFSTVFRPSFDTFSTDFAVDLEAAGGDGRRHPSVN